MTLDQFLIEKPNIFPSPQRFISTGEAGYFTCITLTNVLCLSFIILDLSRGKAEMTE